jgi:lysophospholipid acyltransferase (LPLAT)-like uncharacterized protein
MRAGDTLLRRFLYTALAETARMVCLTLRITRKNAAPLDELRRAHKNCVIVFWHGAMIPGWFFHRRTEQVSALVSLSKDGTILASVLERWGFRLVRGSSHIGGKEALRMMSEALRQGSTICVTPDGPRGPRHVMKAGAALAARRAGVPLVIAGIAMKHKKIFARSWDKFEIPLPFSNVCIWYDEPILFPPYDEAAHASDADADRQAFNELVRSFEARLAAVHEQAHRELGITPV